MLSRLLSLFKSRKYLAFLYVVISASTLLAMSCKESSCLPPDDYQSVVIWMCLLFFSANTLQKLDAHKAIPERSLREKLASQKFLAVIGLYTFVMFALMDGLLPATVYANVVVWVSGLYFGVDVASIYAYRQGKLGSVLTPSDTKPKSEKEIPDEASDAKGP